MVKRGRVSQQCKGGERRGARWSALSALAVIAMIAAAGIRANASSDIVLYASDVTRMQGNWALATSSSGAGNQVVTSVDRGWSSVNNALAAPADYVDVTFSAPSYTPYHVWVRLRAGGDSKYNDSVWVQFSDALDLNQNAVYRTGSSAGLLLNLENCSGCGTSGWGWQDNAYWLQQANIVQFSGGTTHTIRVQTREDGVQFDQIVLSPATYLNTSPGSVRNDSTIVPKSSSSAPPAGSSPYSGTAASIPGLIQNEQFDNGGEGVSYHDSSVGNNGGAFRQTDVDIETSSSGYNVGWVAAGEWLKYSVNVASAGSYMAEFRVASSGQGGTFHLEMNGTDVTGAMSVPNTGGWQSWQTISKTVSLVAGAQSARLVMDNSGSAAVGNFDWMQFTATTTAPPPPPSGNAPAVPNSPNAPDGTTGVTVTPNLSWRAAGATAYDVRLGTSSSPSTVISGTPDFWYGPSALSAGTRYYWQIVAKNSGGSTAGPVWSFVTEGGAPPPPPPPPVNPGGTTLSVVTWNIEINDNSETHARVAMDNLLAVGPRPDVIVIQEAYLGWFNTYIDELQRQTGQTWKGAFATHCQPGAWNGSSCNSTWYQGVGIFSRYNIVNSSSTMFAYPDCWTSGRAGLRAGIDVNGTVLQVFTTHLQTGGCTDDASARYNSMARLKSWASNYSSPQIVAGDFNADPDQVDTFSGMLPTFIDTWALVGSGRGFSAFGPSPQMKIDYWFSDTSGRALPMSSQVVYGTGSLSDHYPVQTTFLIR